MKFVIVTKAKTLKQDITKAWIESAWKKNQNHQKGQNPQKGS